MYISAVSFLGFLLEDLLVQTYLQLLPGTVARTLQYRRVEVRVDYDTLHLMQQSGAVSLRSQE